MVDVPEDLADLWWRSKLWFRRGGVLCVHGGLSEHGWSCTGVGNTLKVSRPFDIVWDRSTNHRVHQLGSLIVHGHTVSGSEVHDRSPWTVGLDTGAAFGGPISAAELDATSGRLVAVHATPG